MIFTSEIPEYKRTLKRGILSRDYLNWHMVDG